jgi:hypothetical protein
MDLQNSHCLGVVLQLSYSVGLCADTKGLRVAPQVNQKGHFTDERHRAKSLILNGLLKLAQSRHLSFAPCFTSSIG